MPHDDDPVAAAEEAAQAMRALARATRHVQDPSTMSWTMGNLLTVASRLITVLEQVAEANRDNLQSAHDTTGRRTRGRAFALSAAADLHKAAIAHAEAFRRLNRAAQSSGQIAWYADDPANPTPVTPVAAHPVAGVHSSHGPAPTVAEPGL